jgi:DNA mismatch endonuclease (patch repair protein)
MLRNAERDRRSTQLAQAHGWRVIRVWECQVRRDPTAVATSILG